MNGDKNKKKTTGENNGFKPFAFVDNGDGKRCWFSSDESGNPVEIPPLSQDSDVSKTLNAFLDVTGSGEDLIRWKSWTTPTEEGDTLEYTIGFSVGSNFGDALINRIIEFHAQTEAVEAMKKNGANYAWFVYEKGKFTLGYFLDKGRYQAITSLIRLFSVIPNGNGFNAA